MKNIISKYFKKSKLSWHTVSYKYLSFSIGIFLILITIFLWRTVEVNNLSLLSQNTTSMAKIYVNKIDTRYRGIDYALGEISRNSPPSRVEDEDDWDTQVDFYINNLVGIDSIAWVDNDLLIRRALPIESGEQLINQNYGTFVLNSNHFVQWTPIYNDEIIEGFILANISISELVLSVSPDLEEDYMIQIFNENSLIYASQNWTMSNEQLTVRSKFSLDSIESYELTLTPTKGLIASSTLTSLQILIYGFLLSIGVSVLVNAVQRFRRKSKLLAKSQESLLIKQTQLKKQNVIMEGNLRNQQKLESIGILASGVAHEINNPINGIMNYSQLILDDSEKGSDTAEYAREIIIETERVSTLVQNLLQFSRQERQNSSLARPEDIISRAASLMNTIFKKDQIGIQMNFSEDLPNINCRSQQIQQVIMNLLANARDALNEKYAEYNTNKIVSIDCAAIEKEGKQWVRITIEDRGNGIPKLIQEKMFTQFFTTKAVDKGTGLGLSISYKIVKEHNGELTFETQEGSFTRFFLELPCDND